VLITHIKRIEVNKETLVRHMKNLVCACGDVIVRLNAIELIIFPHIGAA